MFEKTLRNARVDLLLLAYPYLTKPQGPSPVTGVWMIVHDAGPLSICTILSPLKLLRSRCMQNE